MGLTFHPDHALKTVVGLDEAGRGCLAGPVTAAAVVLPVNFSSDLLDDSKKLTAGQRNLLRRKIESEAIAYGVGFVTPSRIDEINILNAAFEAMHRAIDKLRIDIDLLIVDGNRFNPYPEIPHECIVKGDGKFLSIAAASILAKTYRDEYMECQHLQYPYYYWDKNKGYPTKAHRLAIQEHGVSPLHRQSFRLSFPKQ